MESSGPEPDASLTADATSDASPPAETDASVASDVGAAPPAAGDVAGGQPSAEAATAPSTGGGATPPGLSEAAAPSSDAGAPGAGPDDVTFFAFGDPQYGGADSDKNSFHIQALNAAPTLVWPAGAGFQSEGRPVGAPRGVVIAGDLTQNGQAGRDPLTEWYTGDAYAFDVNTAYGAHEVVSRVAAELGLFVRDYGLRGGDGVGPFVLKWPVFEGYGNHDFDVLEHPSLVYAGQAPARDIVSIRNRVRGAWPEVRRFAAGNAGHYSWDWGRAHFVQLNLVASDARATNADDDSGTQMERDPQGARTFLTEDLAAEVGDSCRPVIVIMHYGFDAFSDEGRWWDEAQRLTFLAAVRPYNVVAILHGHVHETRAYTLSDATGKTYDVFSLGSPFYNQGTNNGRGHFAVFRLSATHIDAADISWLPANPSPGMADGKDLWTGKTLADLAFQTTTTFADGWGGWSFSKEFEPTACVRSDSGQGPAPDASATGNCAVPAGSFAPSCVGCATFASANVCELGCESCATVAGTPRSNPSVLLPCTGDVANEDGQLVCRP
jgi:cytolysin (calcineurin-like family phosphatase)